MALSGHPPKPLGWARSRAWGAAAVEICAVADGTLDAFLHADPPYHGPWDYLGGLLVCQEAGAAVAEAGDLDLASLEADAKRVPLAAATPELMAEIRATLPVHS